MIVFRTPRELKVYSRILLLNCVVDLIFTTTSFVIEVHVPFHKGYFMAILNGFIASSSAEITFWLANVYFFTLYFTVIAVTVPFVYRYCVICRNYVMSDRAFVALILFTVLFTSALPLTCRLFYYPDMQRILSTQTEIYETLPCRFVGQIPLFSMQLSWSTIVPLVTGTCMVTYSYSVIAVCSYKIWRYLQAKAAAMSRQTASMHRQMNYMLVAQALAPLVLMVVPLITNFTVVWKGVTEADSMMYVTTVLSWIPVANPVCAIYFVKAYRTSLAHILRCGRKSASSEAREENETATTTRQGGLSVATSGTQ